MKVTVLGFVVVSCVLMLGCSNPFGPTNYEMVSGLRAVPENMTVKLDGEQPFSVYSDRGHLDDIEVHISGPEVSDPVCRCAKKVELGRLDKVGSDRFIYYAPGQVPSGISLPTTVEVYASSSYHTSAIIDKNYKTIAQITIVE